MIWLYITTLVILIGAIIVINLLLMCLLKEGRPLEVVEGPNNVQLAQHNGLEQVLIDIDSKSIEYDKEARLIVRPQVFFHITMINEWETMTRMLLLNMDRTLLSEVDVHVVALGSEKCLSVLNLILSKYKNVKVRYTLEDISLGHGPILRIMHRDSTRSSTNMPMLFIHTNGVELDKDTNKNVADWAALMSYFLIEQYKLCLLMLHKVDICGVNFQKLPEWNYYGNFWWVNSRYLKTLKANVEVEDTNMWVCSKNPVAVSLWQSPLSNNHEHDKKIYPMWEYREKPIRLFCTSEISIPFDMV